MPKKLKLDQLKVKSFVTVLEDKKEKEVKGGDTLETNCIDTCIPGLCVTDEFQSCGGTCVNTVCGGCGGGTDSCDSCLESCDGGFQCIDTFVIC